MMDAYILINRKAVKSTFEEYTRQSFNEQDRRVGETHIGAVRISTVFHGLDHGFGGGKPMLFESMAFGLYEARDYLQDRCSTWEEAEVMHEEMCDKVRRLLTPFQRTGMMDKLLERISGSPRYDIENIAKSLDDKKETE